MVGISPEHWHAINDEVLAQTLNETAVLAKFELSSFTIHHGLREGCPVIIVEATGESRLHAVWFDEQWGVTWQR